MIINKMILQSVRFPKCCWSISAAYNWLEIHNIYPLKSHDESLNFYRFRIVEPIHNAQYVDKELPNGIQLILMKI
jgi:hypothetical protein